MGCTESAEPAARLLAAVVGGAIIGSLLLALLVARAPEATEAMLLALPGIDDRRAASDGPRGRTARRLGRIGRPCRRADPPARRPADRRLRPAQQRLGGGVLMRKPTDEPGTAVATLANGVRVMLIDLPGVGRKTANCVLANAFGQPAIMCDTHVIRLSRRLQLSENSDPVKLEFDLAEIIPKKDWSIFSHSLILHGRNICQARRPDCPNCAISKYCPSANKPELW